MPLIPKIKRSFRLPRGYKRLKCNTGNYQCGMRCQSEDLKCHKNANGIPKSLLEWNKFASEQKQRAERVQQGRPNAKNLPSADDHGIVSWKANPNYKPAQPGAVKEKAPTQPAVEPKPSISPDGTKLSQAPKKPAPVAEPETPAPTSAAKGKKAKPKTEYSAVSPGAVEVGSAVFFNPQKNSAAPRGAKVLSVDQAKGVARLEYATLDGKIRQTDRPLSALLRPSGAVDTPPVQIPSPPTESALQTEKPAPSSTERPDGSPQGMAIKVGTKEVNLPKPLAKYTALRLSFDPVFAYTVIDDDGHELRVPPSATNSTYAPMHRFKERSAAENFAKKVMARVKRELKKQAPSSADKPTEPAPKKGKNEQVEQMIEKWNQSDPPSDYDGWASAVKDEQERRSQTGAGNSPKDPKPAPDNDPIAPLRELSKIRVDDSKPAPEATEKSQETAPTARSLLLKAKTEKEYRDLIARAEKEAVAEIMRHKQEMAALTKSLVEGAKKIAGADSETKRKYLENADEQLEVISQKSMNRFFELTPYGSRRPNEIPDDIDLDKRLRDRTTATDRWQRGKIEQYGNAVRKFSDIISNALGIPVHRGTRRMYR